MFPVIWSTVGWILEALHAYLIAIIYTWDTRICHLPHHSHAQARHAEIIMIIIEAIFRLLYCRHPIIVRCLSQKRQYPLYIMAAKQVHHGIEVLLWIILTQALETTHCHPAIAAAKQEIQYDLSERIIHSGIYFMSTQVFARCTIADFIRCILPYFADENSVRICLFHLLKEGLRKLTWELIYDIKSPSADTSLHPMMQYTVLVPYDEIHIRRCRLLDIWQCGEVPPAFILIRIITEIIPSIVW